MRPAYGHLSRRRRDTARADWWMHMALTACLMALASVALWCVTAPVSYDRPATPPAVHVTTTVGPPVTGPGQ